MTKGDLLWRLGEKAEELGRRRANRKYTGLVLTQLFLLHFRLAFYWQTGLYRISQQRERKRSPVAIWEISNNELAL